MSMENRLTNDAIRDGIFKKDNAGNKRRSDDRSRNREGHFAEHCTGKVADVRPRKTCFEYGSPNHFRNNYPRLIRTSNQGRNRPNQVLAIEGNCNLRNNANKARGRDFIMGANEAHHRDCYESEIENGLRVETNKIFRGCRLELEGYTFTIDLIPFGHGSFYVIVGIDWLSNLQVEIICHEMIVRIPLSNGEILEVHGERPEGKSKHLKSMKTDETDSVLQENYRELLEDCQTSHPRGKVIAYASRKLKIYEKNYTTYDMELGAVIFALKTWIHYLYKTKSVIYTDHKSLQRIFDQKELKMRQRRWIELFSDYDYEIRYHPEKKT
ncbi:putative reverse transcriptase domain-containing protein [Tanacetum coccineum]|uniref:Reverse transcriptase domain-containing protein n=1 Tax=Tanacetum coccineum TaxID=301880 RepID=A0ABQ5HVL3_9ASTR